MKFFKNKIVSIPIGIILFIILLGISPKLAGILVIFGALGLGVYLYTKSERFNYNPDVLNLSTIINTLTCIPSYYHKELEYLKEKFS